MITAVILLRWPILALLREHRRRKFSKAHARQRMAELVYVTASRRRANRPPDRARNQPAAGLHSDQRQNRRRDPEIPDARHRRTRYIVNDILQDDRRQRSHPEDAQSAEESTFLNRKISTQRRRAGNRRISVDAGVARKVELTSLITQNALPILGDRIQLQQVILNLVVNGIDAMRETPAENRIISIRTSRVDNFAELSVSDLGPGIPEDKLKEIFEPFFTSKADGMGMGLSIARTIVEAHNGLIWAKNRDRGGASFRIKLPLVR